MSCDINFEIVLDNSSVASLFALLIAVGCAIKSRNIVVVSSDAARGVAFWLFNAVISARNPHFASSSLASLQTKPYGDLL